jgi:Mrr N-terminal domain/Endonuclease NucS
MKPDKVTHMALPDRQTIKKALLTLLADGQAHRSDEIEERLISHFELTAEDLAERTKTGRSKFGNELDWAKVELGQEGLAVKPANKHYQITQKGLAKLGLDPSQPSPPDIVRPGDLGNDFEKETELQKALRANIEQLEAGLKVTDGGKEKIVPSGKIDITAEDKNGKTVVIELKSGVADRDAVAQIASYLGDVANGGLGIRGILIAHDFLPRALAAARMISCLELHRYGYRFTFEVMS